MEPKPAPPQESPTHVYGRAEIFAHNLGIDHVNGPLIASIIIFGAQVEHYLERAIWQLSGDNRTKTPDKPVSALHDMLEKLIPTVEDEAKRNLLSIWLEAARHGATVRNNIAHGVALRLGDSPSFLRNPRWEGVKRKKDFGSFHGDVSTLIMARDSIATLLRAIIFVAKGADDLASDDLALKALKEARSMLGEFADHTYNPSVEKY